MTATRLPLFALLSANALLAAACAEPFDTTRQTRPLMSLGGEVYLELCNRVASSADPYDFSGERSRGVCMGEAPADGSFAPAVQALAARRTALVGVIDHLVPPPRTEAFGGLLRDALPLFDDGTVPTQLRATAGLLTNLETSPQALDSLEKLGRRAGYRPLRVATGLLRPLLAYERLTPTVDSVIGLVTPEGAARPAFTDLLRVGEAELLAWQPAPAEPTSLRRLLLREDLAFSDGVPRYVVERDHRGIAVPSVISGGDFTGPFADNDHDGAADVDRGGRFVGPDGRPLEIAAPFAVFGEPVTTRRDTYSRLLDLDQRLVFRYVDSSRTLAGGLIRQTGDLVAYDSGILLDLALPARHLLGPAAQRTASIGGRSVAFRGYDVAQSPLLDVAHAAGSMLDKPITYWTLRLFEDLLHNREVAIAEAIDLGWKAGDYREELGLVDTSLEPNRDLAGDFIRLGTEIAAQPGLLEDLLSALRDEDVLALGPFFADFLRHRDFITYNPNNINGPAIGYPDTPVNRDAADSLATRSIFQRFLHLIHDTNGARLCNKAGAVLDLGFISYPFFGTYDECELFEIDNMAVFYMEAILGEAELVFKDPIIDFAADFDVVLESLSGITGFGRRPTPAAINRLIFAPRNAFLQQIFAPPKAADGGSIEARHPGTIFAWEAPGFFTALTPIVDAFASNGRADLFAELMSVMHRHWPEPGAELTQSSDPDAPAFSKQSGMRRFEPLIATLLDDGQALRTGKIVLEAIEATAIPTDDTPVLGDTVLIDLVRQLLLPAWNEDLRTRQGGTSIVGADGEVIEPLAPVWLLRDAFAGIDDALAPHGGERQAFEGAMDLIAERFLGVERYGADAWLENRRVHAALGIILPWAADRLAEHWDMGDIEPWAATTTSRAQDSLAAPLLGAGMQLLDSLSKDATARRELELLLGYLVDKNEPEVFDTMLAVAVDTLQLLDDSSTLTPLLRATAPALTPDSGALDQTLVLVRRLRARDGAGVLTDILRGLVSSPTGPSGQVSLETLADALVEVNRQVPGAGGAMSAADYGAVFSSLRTFFADGDRGIERLFELVEER